MTLGFTNSCMSTPPTKKNFEHLVRNFCHQHNFCMCGGLIIKFVCLFVVVFVVGTLGFTTKTPEYSKIQQQKNKEKIIKLQSLLVLLTK